MLFSKKPTYDHAYYPQSKPSVDFAVGLVVDCNPAGCTVDVQLETGAMLTSVPLMNTYGSAVGTDLTWLNNYRGSTVVLVKIGGQFYVFGTMPVQHNPYYDTETKEKILANDKETTVLNSPFSQDVHKFGFGGDDVATYQKAAARDWHSGRPMDFMQGDKVLSNDVGSSVGIFKEGVIRIKASPLAQIILGKYRDFCRIVARTFQGYFDFGEVHIDSDKDGNTSLQILGGAKFKTESSPDNVPGAGKWTIQVFMGNYKTDDGTDLNADNEYTPPEVTASRFYVRVTNADDDTKYSGFMLDNGGGFTLQSSETYTDTNKNRKIEVLESEERIIGQDRTLEVNGDDTVTIMQDASKSVTGSWGDTCNGSRSIAAVGAITIQSDTSITIKAPQVNIVRG